MISKRRASRLLGAVLLVLSVFSAGGVRCVGTAEEAAWKVLASADGVNRAIETLQSGQVLHLDVAEVVLDATVVITTSNVELRGRPERTRVLCPRAGGAFIVRGTNVTLRDLEFSRCTAHSAVIVNGTGGDIVTQARRHYNGNLENVFVPDVYIRDCMFTQNVAPLGAAVYAEKARLLIEGTAFVDNAATNRVAMIDTVESHMVVDDRSLPRNAVDGDHGGAISITNGGAVFALRSDVRFMQVVFSGNYAEHYGGGISGRESSLTVTDTTFTENRAEGFGGAVYLVGGELASRKAVFVGNKATDGGAIYAQDCVLTIETTTLNNNSAKSGKGRGGAIYALRQGEVSDVFTNIRETNFTDNVAHVGGAVATIRLQFNAANSRFTSNAATGLGGAITFVAPASASSIVDSYFERNSANVQGDRLTGTAKGSGDPIETWASESQVFRSARYGAGAVFVQDVESFKIIGSAFRENNAHQGGAIVVNGRAIATEMHLVGCLFRKNEGKESGGAVHVNGGGTVSLEQNEFHDNSAYAGGAIYLTIGSTLSTSLRTEEQLYFQNNSAIRGGAIDCHSCVMHVTDQTVFLQNVALIQGGAVSVFGSGMDSRITNATFSQNVAAFGGALYLEDCPFFTCSSESTIEFAKNIALDGGAVYLDSHSAVLEAYEMQNSRFEGNRALDLEDMMSATSVPSLSDWQRQARQAPYSSDSEWPRCSDSVCGRGGALFVGLHNRQPDSKANILLQRLEIIGNEAVVGGGIYIENDVRDSSREVGSWCTINLPILKPCLYLAFQSVLVEDNSALISGGGVFVTAAKTLAPFCIVGPQNLSSACSEGEDSYSIRLQSNTIRKEGGGYGPDLATGAASLRFLNIDDEVKDLQPREKLVACRQQGENCSSSAESGIQLIVQDMLDQTVTAGTPDAELNVDLESEWISGKRAYKASRGIITVNDTFVAGINRTAELIFRSDDKKNLSVGMNFTILPCAPGALLHEDGKGCFKCRENFYAFHPKEKECQLCEEHAICNGTTVLVPEENFWHWTPFSPVMRRCLAKQACSYKNRTESLKAYYGKYKAVQDALGSLERFRPGRRGSSRNEESSAVSVLELFPDYQQCAPGYQGVLCGSCAKNYGHASGGTCEECIYELPLTRLLVALAILPLFFVITVKVVLEVNGVRDDVSFELEKEKRAQAVLIDHAARQNLSEERALTRAGAVDQAQSSSKAGQTAAESSRTAAFSTGAWRSSHVVSRGRLLQRRSNVEDPRQRSERNEDAGTPSSEVMDASAALSDTFKILYNYFQLNSVALSLDANWPNTLDHFFSVEAGLGRSMQIQLLPFDCAFGDREDDVGFPNALATLWYRVCFPVATVAFYLIVMKVYVFFRGESKRSKHKAGLPPKRLIFLVVYLSCCIDIFSELLKVMKCEQLTADVPDYHPYSKYEVVESHYVWMEDTSVTCWQGAHLASAIVAGVGLCICVGIIGFTVAILFVGKTRGLLRNPRFLLRYGFLYLSYRKDGFALYWESVITIRRMLLAGIGVYADHRETSNVEIGFLAFVIFVFAALHEVVKPFDEEDSSTVFPSYAGSLLRAVRAEGMANQWVTFNQHVTLNGMEGASLFMSLSLFLAATCINDNKSKEEEIDILLTVCFAVNSVFVLFMLHRLYYGVHHYLDVIAKERNITFREDATPGVDAKSGIPRKLWIVMKAKRGDADEGTAEGGDVEQQQPLLEETVDEGTADARGAEEPPMVEEISEEKAEDDSNA